MPHIYWILAFWPVAFCPHWRFDQWHIVHWHYIHWHFCSGILPEIPYSAWYRIHICTDRFWWSRSESLTRCDAVYRVKCTATRYLFTTSRLEFLKNYCSINSQNLLWCCSNIIQLYCNLNTRVCKCDDYTLYLLISLSTAMKAHNDWYPKVLFWNSHDGRI